MKVVKKNEMIALHFNEWELDFLLSADFEDDTGVQKLLEQAKEQKLDSIVINLEQLKALTKAVGMLPGGGVGTFLFFQLIDALHDKDYTGKTIRL